MGKLDDAAPHAQRALELAEKLHGNQHPETAKGHVFLSLEDETGMANVIIRPATYRQHKRVLDANAAVVVTGTLQSVATSMERIGALISNTSENASKVTDSLSTTASTSAVGILTVVGLLREIEELFKRVGSGS